MLSKVNAGDPESRGNHQAVCLLMTLVDQIKQTHEFNGGWAVTYGVSGKRALYEKVSDGDHVCAGAKQIYAFT